MLKQAVAAKLPLLLVSTTDLVNLEAVLTWVVGPVKHVSAKNASAQKGVLYCVAPERVSWPDIYRNMAESGSTLIVVNADYDPCFFDCGELVAPDEMVRDFLVRALHAKNPDALMQVFSGLSIKDTAEVSRLAMSAHGKLTVDSVQEMRRLTVKRHSGVHQVLGQDEFYSAPEWVADWLKVDGELFKAKHAPSFLLPRGMLFEGAPGTGKTSAAKFLSRQLGVPLYRLDIGSLLGKYVGESEKNLSAAFSYVDRSSPCVLLLDEVEKLFQTGTDDAGVTSRLLSSILWWLQEHTSRVLVLMTTNDMTVIPKELYRPGRIDSVREFTGVNKSEALAFIRSVVEALVSDSEEYAVDLKRIVQRVYSGAVQVVSQALLVQEVYGVMKRRFLNEGGK